MRYEAALRLWRRYQASRWPSLAFRAFQAAPPLLALWLLITNLRAHRCAILDDAFISFRFAANLAHGFGFRWNPAALPVEGASNMFFVMILAAIARSGLDVPTAARVIGICATTGTAILIMYVCRQLAPTASLLGGALFIAIPATAFHALSGLETSLYTFSLVAFVCTLWSLHRRRPVGSLILVLMTFTMVATGRPEGIAVAGCGLVGWSSGRYAHKANRRELLVLCIAAGACATVSAILFAWKLFYFGTVFSPPYWVKRSTPSLDAGLGYDIAFLIRYAPMLSLALVRLWRGRLHAFESAAVAVILGHLVIFSAVEPLMGVEGRYLAPSLPFLIVLAASPLHEFLSGVQLPARVIAGTMAVVLLVPQMTFAQADDAVNVRRLLGRIEPQFCASTWTGRDRQIGQRLQRVSSPSVRVLTEDVGAVAFLSGAAVLDPVGLTDQRIARSASAREFADVVFDFQPDLVILRGRTSAQDPFAGMGGHGAIGRFGKRAILDDNRFAAYVYLGAGPSDPENTYLWHFWSKTGTEHIYDGVPSYRDEPIDW
jgi:arabinofuranosyltransferase